MKIGQIISLCIVCCIMGCETVPLRPLPPITLARNSQNLSIAKKHIIKKSIKSRQQICNIYGHKSGGGLLPKCLRCQKYIPKQENKEGKIALTEKDRILKAFEKEKFILIAFEKAGFDFLKICSYLQIYADNNKEITLEGFITYLRQINEEKAKHYNGINDWRLNILFDAVRMNYELIKKYEKND